MSVCTSTDPTDHQGDTCPVHESGEQVLRDLLTALHGIDNIITSSFVSSAEGMHLLLTRVREIARKAIDEATGVSA